MNNVRDPKGPFFNRLFTRSHGQKECPRLKGGSAINQKRSLTKSTSHRVWQDLIDESAAGVKNQPRLDCLFLRERDLYVNRAVVRSGPVPHRELFTRTDTRIDALGKMPPDVTLSLMALRLKREEEEKTPPPPPSTPDLGTLL